MWNVRYHMSNVSTLRLDITDRSCSHFTLANFAEGIFQSKTQQELILSNSSDDMKSFHVLRRNPENATLIRCPWFFEVLGEKCRFSTACTFYCWNCTLQYSPTLTVKLNLTLTWMDGQHQSDSSNHYRGPRREGSLDAHTCCHTFWFSFLPASHCLCLFDVTKTLQLSCKTKTTKANDTKTLRPFSFSWIH